MLYQYPLESLARRRATTSQLDFARAARKFLVDTDDAMFEAHEHGLAIFTANEDALATPAQVLREMYGDFVEVRQPRVRIIPGSPPQQPIMHARITARSDFALKIRAELRQRGASLLEHCARGSIEVIRAEAPLASLLGLPARLGEITGGTATHVIRLARYAAMPPDPRPAA
jgi:hypothetical protein